MKWFAFQECEIANKLSWDLWALRIFEKLLILNEELEV